MNSGRWWFVSDRSMIQQYQASRSAFLQFSQLSTYVSDSLEHAVLPPKFPKQGRGCRAFLCQCHLYLEVKTPFLRSLQGTFLLLSYWQKLHHMTIWVTWPHLEWHLLLSFLRDLCQIFEYNWSSVTEEKRSWWSLAHFYPSSFLASRQGHWARKMNRNSIITKASSGFVDAFPWVTMSLVWRRIQSLPINLAKSSTSVNFK